MSQIFHRSSNTLSKVSLYGIVIVICAIGYLSWQVNESAYYTYEKRPIEQPVPFSHEHHTVQLGIDCRYCHTSVESSWFAGVPPTQTCMSCHSQVWVDSPMLEPVRSSYRTNNSIVWTRINTVPDFVFFNHSIHISKGIGCTTCHGQLGTMPITYRENTLYMRWCINCHKHPEQFVRPKKDVFDPVYHRPPDQLALGRKLVKEYKIKKLTSCDTCHR